MARAVAIDGAKVALAIDEGVTEGEVLGHADHGSVAGLSPWVVTAHDVADDGRRTCGTGAGACAAVEHAPEDLALDGFEAVGTSGEARATIHAHGVVE